LLTILPLNYFMKPHLPLPSNTSLQIEAMMIKPRLLKSKE